MSELLELWPAGAPGLDSATPVHVPALTPYLVEGDGARGLVVVCPGGGYGHRAPHEGEPIARMLNAAGFSAAVCHYRVAPYRHPYPSMDARRAIRVVRHHAAAWGVNPAKVGILGFSAGGHLASTVATHLDAEDPRIDEVDRQSSRPDAAILCYPVISFGKEGHEGSAQNLLGDALDESTRRAFSNHLRVTAETPPCFLWHTAADAGVPAANSLLFAEALSRHKVPFALHVFPHGGHGLGLAPDNPQVAQWAGLCTQWLHELGF